MDLQLKLVQCISVACEFLATVLRILSRTFALYSCECRENFHVSRTGREGFKPVKNFTQIFSPKYFARLSRRSCECCEPVAAKFLGIYNAKFSRLIRMSCNSLEKTCKHLATIWQENKTKRHSYECLATVVRMKISYIRGNVVSHSHECLVVRHNFKIRQKFAKLSHKCPFIETAT